jgi:hypothetical protein
MRMSGCRKNRSIHCSARTYATTEKIDIRGSDETISNKLTSSVAANMKRNDQQVGDSDIAGAPYLLFNNAVQFLRKHGT